MTFGLTLEGIVWLVLLIDSVGAVLTAYFFRKQYKSKFKGIANHFPATKGWTLFYLALMIWIGTIMYRSGLL